MARTGSLRRAIGALAAAAGVVAVPVAATADSGTWGVAHVPYQAGVVCQAGPLTSPLVRWDFGDPTSDFLLQAVTSDGKRDSAQLPVAGTPNRFSTALVPGQYGFGSADDIAAYAALLSRYGSAHAGAVALALLERSDPGHAPPCVSAGAAAALRTRAQAQAGPYELSVAPAHRPVVLGAADTLTVRVTGRSGAPAPGVRVSISSSAAVFAGSSSATAVTNSDGQASAPFDVPDDFAEKELSFDASASVSTGLQAVTVAGGFGANRYAPVAFATPPEAASAHTAVPIDLTADPHIAVALPAGAVVVHRAVHLGAQITGLRGHTGEAQITAVGPQPLDKSRLCAGASAGANLDTAYDSGDIDLRGDEKVTANRWTPNRPGCYVLRSRVVTTNAVPEAEAHGATLVVTVLDTHSSLSAVHTLVGRGPLTAKVHVDHSYGLSGTAHVRLLGPMNPTDNDCAGLKWAHAGTAAAADRPIDGDDDYPIRTDPVSDSGCYLITGSVELSVPGAGSARVPLNVSPESKFAYVLNPSLRLTADDTSTTSPDPVGARVEVAGTLGQAGHLRVAMVHAVGGTFGCAQVDYADGQRESLGPAVAISGDGTYPVKSGATPKNGCYTLVPILVMDANTSITATGKPGADGTTIVAGAAVGNRPDKAQTDKPGPSSGGSDVWTSVLVYAGIAVLVLGVLFALVGLERRRRSRPAPGLDVVLGADALPETGRRSRVARSRRGGHRAE